MMLGIGVTPPAGQRSDRAAARVSPAEGDADHRTPPRRLVGRRSRGTSGVVYWACGRDGSAPVGRSSVG